MDSYNVKKVPVAVLLAFFQEHRSIQNFCKGFQMFSSNLQQVLSAVIQFYLHYEDDSGKKYLLLHESDKYFPAWQKDHNPSLNADLLLPTVLPAANILF